ncbi:GDSL-type esterase/lipase family protein [Dyadobacter sp. CY327]|uniref:GDSL-type esterase/lipase family protein n=1 Tax=Dyadobacter sp. CY327 TaxID=2907301 RepID=UPI001F1F42ED|nr:GDSL-type esterase/lipase family protein [Dyadobacter sp. CY327]MCE7070866.1 GDSL-type esterase/lipase family protein [Dyadobacter sp. CY327]
MNSRRKFLKTAGIGAAALGLGTQQMAMALHPEKTGDNTDTLPDLERVKELLASQEPHIWLFTGDSITHGAKHTKGYRSYPEIFGERLRWELKRMRDVVINTGISGNTTVNILSDFEWRVSQFRPAMVSLMIGTNDCAKKEMTADLYQKNLERIVTKIRDIGAVPIFHTPNSIIAEKDPSRSKLSDYMPFMRQVADEKGVILVDNYQYWEDSRLNNAANVYRDWLNDPIHPGETGHQEIARLMFKTISIFDPQEPTCGGGYYEGEH